MVFPVVTHGRESWTIKQAERRRINALELWCWKRLLRVPWTAMRSNQSILKEISPEYSLGGLMHRTDSLEKTQPWCWARLKAEGGRQDGWQVGWHHWLDEHEFEQALRVGDEQGSLVCCSPRGRKESDTTEWLNWTDEAEHMYSLWLSNSILRCLCNIISYTYIPKDRHKSPQQHYLYHPKPENTHP